MTRFPPNQFTLAEWMRKWGYKWSGDFKRKTGVMTFLEASNLVDKYRKDGTMINR